VELKKITISKWKKKKKKKWDFCFGWKKWKGWISATSTISMVYP